MQKTVNQEMKWEVQEDDKLAIARMITRYFFDALENGSQSGYGLTDHPGNAPLLAALKELVPDATNTGMLAKMLCIFGEGVNVGIEIANLMVQCEATA